jgi:hypothetical protein
MKYQLKTFADIVNAVLEEVKIQASDTTTVNRIKRDINIVYLNEVLPFDQWHFARHNIKVTQEKYYNTGTVTVTQDSASITFSTAPAASQKGRLFATDGYAEVYKISSHTAGATSATLDAPFRGATASAQNFKIFNEGIQLPVDLVDTVKVWHDHIEAPCQAVADSEFLELMLNSPKREGYPRWYRVSDVDDPELYADVSGLPAVSTVSSIGNVRTIVFGADIEDYLEQGDRLLISDANNSAFNGEVLAESVSGSTLDYVGEGVLDSNAAADLNITIQKQNSPATERATKKLQMYPCLNKDNVTINIEYMKDVDALENDTDQPIIPINDRIVLMYGALAKAWARLRNTEESLRNSQQFEQKLARMAGKIKSSADHPQLQVDRFYLAGKRRGRSSRWSNF